jgi:elongation factor G
LTGGEQLREINDGAPLSVALKPKTRADEEKLGHGLGKLLAEDPMLRVRTDPATGDVVIAGTGELHLEIILDRLKREFNVEAGVGRPQVAYRETLTCPADGEMKYAMQAGDRGQYAHVKIHVSPCAPGTGVVFENSILVGTIPGKFIAAIEEGIEDALVRGVLAGHPVDDVRIVLYDGSYHDVDSSEMAFKIAASMAFTDAARKAKPVLLEPVMLVQVSVPTDDMDDVMKNLTSRRGRVQSHENRSGTQVIDARLPLSEMFGYSTDLRERTLGRGTFAMRLELYQPCRPADGSDGSQDSLVGAPLKPRPTRRDSGIALPEPDEDGLAE